MTQQKWITPQTVNKILAVAYLCIGAIDTLTIASTSALLISDEREPLLHLRPQKQVVAVLILVALLFSVMQLIIGLGLLKRWSWARAAALVFSLFFAVYIPVGLALCVFTWWFLRSEDGRKLYGRS
jgi:Na+-transporting NADH:ubiquinone oxidoreductase subunit NqrB